MLTCMNARTCTKCPHKLIAGYTHSLARVKMANQPVASENLTLLGIQSFVRGRQVYRTSQLRSWLLTYVKIKNYYSCTYSLAFTIRCSYWVIRRCMSMIHNIEVSVSEGLICESLYGHAFVSWNGSPAF